jgi:hypothetical protein
MSSDFLEIEQRQGQIVQRIFGVRLQPNHSYEYLWIAWIRGIEAMEDVSAQ